MKTLLRLYDFASAANIIPWMLNLATRILARTLNMPEPLLETTGLFMVAQVQTVEISIGRTLCPTRLLRQLRKWLRRWAR